MFYGSAMTVAGMAIAEGIGRAIGGSYSYGSAVLYAGVSVVFLCLAAYRNELSR